MFEQMKRASILLMVGAVFSSGAWGQVVYQTLNRSKTIAAEYFGTPDSRLVAARSELNSPVLLAIFVGDGDISGGNEANLTFSLVGATFADRVPLSLFGSNDEHISLKLEAGGEKGDNSVTVRIAVAGGGVWDDDNDITFIIPDLLVAPALLDPTADPPLRGVTIDTSIEAVRRTSNPFPDVVGSQTKRDQDSDPRTIYKIAPAVEIILSSAAAEAMEVGEVDLTNRKVIASNYIEGIGETGRLLPEGSVAIGLLTATANAGVKALAEATTNLDPDVTPASLPGELVVTATGNFQTDDTVWIFGLQGDAATELTQLTQNEGGSYSGGIAIEEVGVAITMAYIPGGVDDLLPGTFNTTAEVRYDDPKNASGPVQGQGTGRIEYRGLVLAAYAHGIVKSGGAAQTYLRVACASTTDCTLFASCRDETSESFFGELGVVPAGGLEVYNSGEIGEALDGGWDTGRGRCDLLSDGVLEVQNMLNQGSLNINNSLVTNGAGVLTRTQ